MATTTCGRSPSTPDSREAVTITLPGGRACGTAGAVCTRGDRPRPLGNSPSSTVAGPPAASLTASFSDMPGEHTGEAFSFGLTFSDELDKDFSYRTLRDEAFAVTGGAVRKAKRQQSGSNLGWTITVEPDGAGAVAIRLPETTDCHAGGALCTGDGRPLSTSLSATVAGPVGIAVADARVEEDAGALLAFVVTLSRAASRVVTVDYATADGTAQAGVDYTAASGTLTFPAGASSQTVEVAVLDDAHDEGEETLTLTLSNAAGGRLTDGEATGTIKNRDPLPRALLARFGRTAAVHVVEHVEERLQAPREPGFRGRFAGQELRPGMAARDRAQRPQPARGLGRCESARRGRPRSDGRRTGGPRGIARDTGAGRRRHAAGRGGRADGRRVGTRRHGGSAGRRGRAGRRAHRRRTPPDGPRRRGSADRLGVRDEPGNAPRRDPLGLEPGGAVPLRRPRGGAVARRRRAHHDGRGRLRDGAGRGGAVALAQPGPGRVRRRHGRTGGLVGDRPLPVAGLPGDRSDHGVGRDGLRCRRTVADARRRAGAQERAVDGDGGGWDTGRAGRGRRGRPSRWRSRPMRCGSARRSTAWTARRGGWRRPPRR